MARRIDIQIKARDEASAQLERIGGGVDKLTGKLDTLRNLAVAGVGLHQLAGYINGSLDAFSKEEQAVTRLTQSLGMLGKASQSGEMQEFSKSLAQVTRVSDLASMKIMGMGAAMGHMSGDTLKKATAAAVGLSQAYGIDLEQSMRLVIDASQGQTSGLRRLGIETKGASTDQERFNVLLNEGARGLKSATQDLTTYEGKMAQLKNRLADTREEMGSRLAPVVIKVADIMLDYAIPAMENYQLVWEFTSATVETEALKVRDTVDHVFRDEMPEAVKAFSETVTDELKDLMENQVIGIISDMPGKVQAALATAMPKIQSAVQGAVGQPPTTQPASQPASSTTPQMTGAGAPVYDANYDPTGGRSLWGENKKAIMALASGEIAEAAGVVRSSYGHSLSTTRAGMGKRAANLQSAATKIGVGLAAPVLLSGGSTTAAGVGATTSMLGFLLGNLGLTPASGAAATTGGSVAGRAGVNAATTGGFWNMARAAATGVGGPPPAAGALFRGARAGGLWGGLAATGAYLGLDYLDRKTRPGNIHPYVGSSSELDQMRAELGSLPVGVPGMGGALGFAVKGITSAQVQGIMPDEWSPDTKAAQERRDGLRERMRNMFADNRKRRADFLANINKMGDQDMPGGVGAFGADSRSLPGREFRFATSAPSRRLETEPLRELVKLQQKLLDEQSQKTTRYQRAEQKRRNERRIWATQFEPVGTSRRFR